MAILTIGGGTCLGTEIEAGGGGGGGIREVLVRGEGCRVLDRVERVIEDGVASEEGLSRAVGL